MEFLENLRILGVYLNNQWNLKNHPAILKEKSSKRLNMIKAITGICWGTETKYLIRITRCIIGSLFDGNPGF